MRSAETNRIDMGIFIHIDLLVSAMKKKELIADIHYIKGGRNASYMSSLISTLSR